MKRLAASIFGLMLFSSTSWAYTWGVQRNLYQSGWSTGFTITGSLTSSSYGLGSTTCGYMTYNSSHGTAVNTTLRYATPGLTTTYYLYTGLGSYPSDPATAPYRAELGNGQLYLKNYDSSSGTYVTVGYTAVSLHDNMTFRLIANNYTVGVFIDDVLTLSVSAYVNSSTYGGIGICSAWSGNAIKHADIGQAETVPPNAIPLGNIGISAFTNHVDLQWPAGSDDANGLGVIAYQVFRNGALSGTTKALTFSDASSLPGFAYTYTLTVMDYFMNTASTTFSVQTPAILTNPPYPSLTPEGRSVGVRTTGTYWGASPENIDVRTGNLSFVVPVLKAKGRGGMSIGLSMAYNSQNWRQDGGGTWQFDGDVGYGFGWRLLAGSVTPIWNPGGLSAASYLFMDSTGAEYRLDQNSGNVWSSKESVYVWFDANTNTLYFKDGTSWYFECISGPGEADAGVLYPTKFQDINSQNTITITYQQGSGASWPNSSARIDKIQDNRAPTGSDWTYRFGYWNGHFTGIQDNISSGEQFSTTYGQNQALSDPFAGAAYPTTWYLSQISIINGSFAFLTNGSGEITRITLPQGGYLGYDYSTVTYSTGRKYREISQRYLSKNGSTQTAYAFSHEPSPGADVHQYTVLNDPGGVGQKKWVFSTSGFSMGLVTQYLGNQLPGPVTLTQNDFTWAQNATNNSYIASTINTLDPGANQVQKKTAQTVDNYGNVTQVQSFAFGNLTTALRTNDYTYSTNSALLNAYIRNRLISASQTEGGNTFTLVTNSWGTDPSSPALWGRLWQSVTAAGTALINYDQFSNVNNTIVNGVSKSATFADVGNNHYIAPTALTVGSQTETFAYASFLAPTTTTGPNGDSTTLNYSNAAQVSSVQTSLGAIPAFTYTTNTTTTTLNGRWSRTTTDGMNRTIKVETGTGATTSTPVSITETEYDSCGCSPLGKLKRTSLPHASGASPLWTTYTYDGIGRTLSVQAPDAASATSYSYLGNTVTVTDPAGKWKKYASDAFGRLTQVNEPNPAGGADYVTNYTYDMLDHLTNVSMPRPSGTQTRVFNYGTPPTPYLQSATNPENGTVNYTYDSSHRLSTVVDAKGQKKVMTYDTLNRVTQISRYYNSTTEDTQQRTNFYYDTNPIDAGYSTNINGRLAAVQYYGGKCTTLGPPRTVCDLIQESYKYNSSGNMTGKRVKITRSVYPTPDATGTLTASWTYDNEGRVTQVQYPSWTCYGCSTVVGSKYNFAYDSMGRLNTMTNAYTSASVISGVTYGVANEIQAISGILNETRQYNSMFQLTRITVPSVLDMQYVFPSAGANNGKIASQTDVLSGEQITYTYDALNRLATAVTSDNPSVAQWGQSYTYDGFGNMTDQVVTKGSGPGDMHVVYNASTNRQSGDTADANGNLGSGYLYDIDNRLLKPGASATQQYGYDAGNKRVWRGDTANGTDEFTFWAGNQKLATYSVATNWITVYLTMTGTNVYFGGRMIAKGTYNSGGTNDKCTLASISQDRLGSMNGKFYPYGQERPSATTNDKEKFTGYFRDAATGLDYADQRYHQAGVGRFMTPDPYGRSAKPGNPGSWNRYAYVGGDPVNGVDHRGLNDDEQNACTISPLSPGCVPFGDSMSFGGGVDDLGWQLLQLTSEWATSALMETQFEIATAQSVTQSARKLLERDLGQRQDSGDGCLSKLEQDNGESFEQLVNDANNVTVYDIRVYGTSLHLSDIMGQQFSKDPTVTEYFNSGNPGGPPPIAAQVPSTSIILLGDGYFTGTYSLDGVQRNFQTPDSWKQETLFHEFMHVKGYPDAGGSLAFDNWIQGGCNGDLPQ